MGSLSSICCGSRHNSDRHVRGRYREGALALVSAVAMNAFVVSGLVKRRSELAGEIERSHEALRKMLSDLERDEICPNIPSFPQPPGSSR